MPVSDSASRVLASGLGYFHGCREVRMEGEWESLQLLNFLTTLTRLGIKGKRWGTKALKDSLSYSSPFTILGTFEEAHQDALGLLKDNERENGRPFLQRPLVP